MTNLTRKNLQNGFTLIELVVVILILGILAVTAAPKFISLTSDAKKSAMYALKGTLASASNLVHSKAIIEGIEKLPETSSLSDNTASITVNGVTIRTGYGYPAVWGGGCGGDGCITSAGISQAIELDVAASGDTEWRAWVQGTSSGTSLVYTLTSIEDASQNAGAITATNCYVRYTEANSEGATPTITVVDSDC